MDFLRQPNSASFLCRLSIATAAWITLAIQVSADENAEFAKWGASYEEKVLPVVRAKCLECHSGENPDGEFDFSKYPDGATAVGAGDAWERVAKRVRLNEMPPPGSPGLSDPEKAAFHRWVDARPNQDLCHQLASDETQSWYRGHVMSRRLSRYEYANAVRDLMGFEVPDDLLPPSDGSGGLGFDTVGDALFTSPIHLEAYIRVAAASVAHCIPKQGSVAIDLQSVNQELTARGAALRWSLVTPADGEPLEMAERRAAEQTLQAFARLAWRRPIASDEVQRLMVLYENRRQKAETYPQSVGHALMAILVSPHFLFLAEPEPETAGVQALTQHQLATRMALLVWSSIPDEELLTLADAKELLQPGVLQVQLHRMLQDDRARSLGENFGLQWLGLRDWRSMQPDRDVFPDYDPELAHDAIEETIRTIASIFREGRPLTELLDSETMWVNPRLARHYELDQSLLDAGQFKSEQSEGVGLSDWARVPSAGSNRGGILTMASVLMKASYPRRTSPVLRGRWILEDILGAKVPPPPPNVPALEDSLEVQKVTTLRARLEIHRTQPECASCHQRMDTLGFALENFDAIGRWRAEEEGLPIDATGTLPSGESFSGPEELKRILLQRRDEFQQHAVRKLVGFALGRDLNKFDQCVIDASLKRLNEEHRADVILEEILLSYPFQNRYYNPAKGAP